MNPSAQLSKSQCRDVLTPGRRPPEQLAPPYPLHRFSGIPASMEGSFLSLETQKTISQTLLPQGV